MELPLIKTLFEVLMGLLNFCMIIILASMMASWLGGDPNNRIVQMLHSVTEPVYRPFRKLTRRIPGPFDFAPMAVALIIMTLQVLIKNMLEYMIRGGASGPLG